MAASLELIKYCDSADKAKKLSPFAFCKDCKIADKCCKQLGPEFSLPAPVVSRAEIKKIKNRVESQMSSIDNFIQKPDERITNIITNSDGSCIFHKGNKCKIYDIRPFDCQIFPLDIFKIGSQFCWVAYETFCGKDIAWGYVLAHGEKLLRQYSRNFIQDYATNINEVPPTLAYRILKNIDFFD
jgi:Fe-S-cluster containining protein